MLIISFSVLTDENVSTSRITRPSGRPHLEINQRSAMASSPPSAKAETSPVEARGAVAQRQQVRRGPVLC